MTNIYISPSKQPANTYITGNTNEQAQMTSVARLVAEYLARDWECGAFIATPTLGLTKAERPTEAKNLGCSAYISIHSNAAGSDGKPSSCAGAIGFYHPDSADSRKIAKSIADELDRACPIPSNRSQNTASGMAEFNGQGFGEIRSPWQLGIVPTLIETNFHDNPKTAEYILNNHEEIALAIARGAAAALELPKKSEPPASRPAALIECSDGTQAENVARAMTLLGYKASVISI